VTDTRKERNRAKKKGKGVCSWDCALLWVHRKKRPPIRKKGREKDLAMEALIGRGGTFSFVDRRGRRKKGRQCGSKKKGRRGADWGFGGERKTAVPRRRGGCLTSQEVELTYKRLYRHEKERERKDNPSPYGGDLDPSYRKREGE